MKVPVGGASAFGKDHHRLAGLEQSYRLPGRARVGRVDLDREGPETANEPGEPGDPEERVPGHEVYGEANGNTDEDGIGVGDVIRGDDEGTVGGNMLRSLEADLPIDTRPEVDERADSVQDGRAHAMSVPRRS